MVSDKTIPKGRTCWVQMAEAMDPRSVRLFFVKLPIDDECLFTMHDPSGRHGFVEILHRARPV